MSAPFVTHGSTPLCDACGEYYSERHCTDCAQNQCTWCNLDIHVPIGKRNHWRPRLYGEDPHAELERNATSTADMAVEQAARGARSAAISGSAGTVSGSPAAGRERAMSRPYTVDPQSGRVNVTTEHLLPVTAEEAWDLLGDWEAPFLPFPCDVSDAGDRRVLVLPPETRYDYGTDEFDEEAQDDEDDSEAVEARSHSTVVTERLIQRSDRDMFYSYSRTVPPEAAAAFPYTDLLSKFAFLPASAASSAAASSGVAGPGGKRCVLQWTTSVLPRGTGKEKQAARAVARYQESWRAYFDAFMQEEE